MATSFEINEGSLVIANLLREIRDEADKIVDEEIERVAEGIKQKAKQALKAKALELTATFYESVNLQFNGPNLTFTVKG